VNSRGLNFIEGVCDWPSDLIRAAFCLQNLAQFVDCGQQPRTATPRPARPFIEFQCLFLCAVLRILVIPIICRARCSGSILIAIPGCGVRFRVTEFFVRRTLADAGVILLPLASATPCCLFRFGLCCCLLAELEARKGTSSLYEIGTTSHKAYKRFKMPIWYEALTVDKRAQESPTFFCKEYSPEEVPERHQSQDVFSLFQAAHCIKLITETREQRIKFEPASSPSDVLIQAQPVIADLSIGQNPEPLEVDPDTAVKTSPLTQS
jgi:hypothetical protein